MEPDLVIVGSGFYGSTVARKTAEVLNKKILVLEKRSHTGGNSYSEREKSTEIEVHRYGTHIFHTDNKKVIDFVTRFSDFNNYRHTVWSRHNNSIYSMPVNLATINQVYGGTFTPEEARRLLALEGSEISDNERLLNLENKAISSVGRKIYEALIKDYTEKQWQTPPSMLPAETISRLPVRFNYDNSYFSDVFQGLPTQGYGALFQNLLSHPRIQVEVGVDYFDSKWVNQTRIPVLYTGPIDKFFGYKYGRLNWRTVDFETQILQVEDFQGTAVVNYPDLEVPFTRIHEFKHLHPERSQTSSTIIMREYSRRAGLGDEPYYPVNSPSDREMLLRYRSEASRVDNVWFGGRLGTYQYLDMHMAIASAISFFDNELVPYFVNAS